MKDFVGSDEAYHAAECRISSESTQAHYHDFAEIFWIIEGEGSHQVEAISQKVSKGDLVFLRPQDYHFFEPSSRLRFFNLAFPLKVLEFLHERYFRNAENFYGLNSERPIHSIEVLDCVVPLTVKGAALIRESCQKVWQVKLP